MQSKQQLAVAFVISAALALGVLFVPVDADACSWGAGVLKSTIPDDGAEVPPDAEISWWFKPGGWPEWEFELVDGDDQKVGVEVELLQYGTEMGFVDHYRVVPETLLDTGSYTLTASGEDEFPEDKSLSFEVVDESVDPPGVPEGVHWTRIDNPPPEGECFGQARQWNDIVVDEERDDVWFEIHYDTDGDGVVASHPASEPLRHYIREIAECFTVEAVAIDGTRSEPVERCEPDVCKDGGDYGPLEEVDCDPDGGAGGNGEDGGDDGGGEDDSESTCATVATGPLSALWIVLAALGLGAMRRWT